MRADTIYQPPVMLSTQLIEKAVATVYILFASD